MPEIALRFLTACAQPSLRKLLALETAQYGFIPPILAENCTGDESGCTLSLVRYFSVFQFALPGRARFLMFDRKLRCKG